MIIQSSKVNPELRKILQKQHYSIVGEHSGVKLCHWMRQKLLYGRACYKETFYGIESHRCLQMTPTVNQCNQKCLFCWRFQGFNEKEFSSADDVENILEKSIKAQQTLITGFNGDERCNRDLYKEAKIPKHVAISLAGEPTLYPKLNDFIELCHKKGMTTFLVTNGTTPEVLQKLENLPTQLYITVAAPNKEIYKKLCVPLIPDAWEKLNETLEILSTLDCRKVIRHTLVDNWNLGYEKEYAKLDEKANPNFIEPKGFVFVGYSRERMNISNMPSHEKIRTFSKKLAELTGYEIKMERKDSRVVLLSKDDKIKLF